MHGDRGWHEFFRQASPVLHHPNRQGGWGFFPPVYRHACAIPTAKVVGYFFWGRVFLYARFMPNEISGVSQVIRENAWALSHDGRQLGWGLFISTLGDPLPKSRTPQEGNQRPRTALGTHGLFQALCQTIGVRSEG